MKLYNTLTRKKGTFEPLHNNKIRMYSCGPTVYDHIHIGNLSAFIVADTLRRILKANGYNVQHVMNFTDVDDKTIRRSAERYPDAAPEEALENLSHEYKQIFLDDMQEIGNNVDDIKFVSAVENIEGMRALITDLYNDGFAYITEDGVYFSIETYRSSGKKYGQLLELTASNTSESRIDNDEYDKESAHDFALWKTRKDGEPAWEFELDGHELLGRPGWHIECSVMSVNNLGQPFDIHTGGVDLIFPHHENEIAQSTAGKGDLYAKYFVHNEHLLVDGKKMSKSLGNYYTLQEIRERGYDPLAFRLMVLQSHYRNQSNFTWDNLGASQRRLSDIRAMADIRFQASYRQNKMIDFVHYKHKIQTLLEDDIDTPGAIACLSEVINKIFDSGIANKQSAQFIEFLEYIDGVFGLSLMSTKDITNQQKQLILQRDLARKSKSWSTSDKIRKILQAQGIMLNDSSSKTYWRRL